MKKGKSVKVDFTGVDVTGGGKLLPEGPIQLELKEIEEKEGEDSGKPYLEGRFEVAEPGENEGVTVYDNFSLQPKALWKLRSVMEAGGIQTVDGPMSIDLDELVGIVVVGDIIHEEYKGKQKNRVNGYSSVDGGSTATEESTPAKRKRPARGGDDEPTWKLKQAVTFKDGKKTLSGVITELNGEKVTVKVNKDEYEMETSDLTAA